MDINDSYYPNASNDFPTLTSRKWMNGLNKALNKTTNLVKKAAPLVLYGVFATLSNYFLKDFTTIT